LQATIIILLVLPFILHYSDIRCSERYNENWIYCYDAEIKQHNKTKKWEADDIKGIVDKKIALAGQTVN
jgi:hypothetical protein